MPRIGLVLTGLITIALLVACQTDDDPPPDPTANGCYLQGPGCWESGDKGVYCYLEQIWPQYEAGAFKAKDLPPWADKQLRNGVPKIYNFWQDPPYPMSTGEVQDRLRAWLKAEGLRQIDRDVYRDCFDNTTYAQLENDLGKPPETKP